MKWFLLCLLLVLGCESEILTPTQPPCPIEPGEVYQIGYDHLRPRRVLVYADTVVLGDSTCTVIYKR